MPKIEALEKAAVALTRASVALSAVGDGYGPEMGRRATSVEAVYGMLSGLAGQVGEAGKALKDAATQLRNAAAELESLDES